MEQKTHSQKFLRQRKFFMVLPLLVLPFMTLMFWALGGGKVSQADAQNTKKGFNMQLPGANLKDDKPLDKLSYYEQAASDSLKLEQQIKNDPYYKMHPDTDTVASILIDTASAVDDGNVVKKSHAHSISGYTDPNEAKVYRKLAQLNSALNKSTAIETNTEENVETSDRLSKPSVNSSDVDRLEQMMQAMNQKDGGDPEMQQLGGMLDQILDIQHPERVQERIRQNSELKRGLVFPVTVNHQSDPVSLLENLGIGSRSFDTGIYTTPGQNGFFSFNDPSNGNISQNAIEAVVHETQTLVNGSTVKLRLVNDIYISSVLIPKNNFVFGTAQLNGERLDIKINSIRCRNSLFPVELSVYDMDGMDGIYIPGAITRDVAKQSADRSLQEIGFTPVDPSIGAQAASAGIQAAKTLFSKKVKLIKVTVKAGYQVLLRDEKQRQNN